MLSSRDVIAGKMAVQMGYSTADAVRVQLREMVASPDDPRDLIHRLPLPDPAIQFLRHRVALYEHVRREAVYVRLLERGTTIKRPKLARILAELEHSEFRRRLGDVLVERGNLKPAYDDNLVKKQETMLLRDEKRILDRYRQRDFEGVAKALIPNSKLDPNDFKISTLFRSKETRALVDKAELELLRAEARAAEASGSGQGEVDETATMIMDAPAIPPPALPEADLVETAKLPPGSVAQTKAMMQAMGMLESSVVSQDEPTFQVTIPDPIPDPPTIPPPPREDPIPTDKPREQGKRPVTLRSEVLKAKRESQRLEAEAAAEPGGLTMDDVAQLERIGEYSVVEALGVGGMGAVFLAQKDGSGEYVAIKVLLSGVASLEERGRFEREIKLAQLIDHPNVLHVIEPGRTPEGLSYVAVPALAGKELRDLLKQGSGQGLAPVLVVRIFRQLLAGLAAVHAAKVVHRDLKPENVFVLAGGDHEVRLMDFGVAKPSDDGGQEIDVYRTREMQVAGSPAYIAPESVSCDPIDGRTDVYSLGVLLFEMLTGRLPLASETSHGFLTQHLISPPLSLAEASPDFSWPQELEDLVAAMLSKGKTDRPTCEEILATLDAGLGEKMESLAPNVEEPVDRPEEIAVGPDGKAPWGFKGLLGRLLAK
jgi:serine/threonine protein kinase